MSIWVGKETRLQLRVAGALSPHRPIDPIPEIAALAAARDISCHVDACMGGAAELVQITALHQFDAVGEAHRGGETGI